MNKLVKRVVLTGCVVMSLVGCANTSTNTGTGDNAPELRIATGDDPKVVDQVGGVINPFNFVEIGKDGITRDTSLGMCADPSANQLPDTYGPNQKYQGVMDLEVTDASGTLALQLMALEENGDRGWEWTYPV